jgi:biopolymer transport protein TolR
MPSASSGRGGRRLVNEINVVPYIDVMLVLLVIFMVTAPLIPTAAITVPTAGTTEAQAPTSGYVDVMIAKDGVIKVAPRSLPGKKGERQVKDIEALVAEVRAQTGGNASVPVAISADETIPYKVVIETLTELKRAKVGKVSLMVRQKT